MDLTYITSALEPESWPTLLHPITRTPLPEIALAGRSNVGKSTFLNLLAGTKKLAKVSSIPGKTQRMQFFQADSLCTVVDLPGYGYAKAPPSVQVEWSKAIHAYFTKREQLKKLVLLLDIRRDLSDDDLQMLDWAAQKPSLSTLIVFTKTDTLSRNESDRRHKALLTALSPYNLSETPLSAPTPRKVAWNCVTKNIYAPL